MKKKLMVDCETLDIGERPVLLSIGAVVFDENRIYKYFQIDIDIENSKEHGFTSSQSTLDWWNQQDPIAKNMAFSGKEKIEVALMKLVNFYSENDCDEIWSKGALADIRWINNALDYFGIERPWKYYKEFCFRTLLKSVPKFDMPFCGIQHNALDDAIHQTKQFIRLNALAKNKDKRLERLKSACIYYKNLRNDIADKLMVKSIHYNSIQKDLAELKDRIELANHLATQSTWSSLKQLKKVAKALRGEHA